MEIYSIIKIINIAAIIHGLILSAAIFHAGTKGGKSLKFLSLLVLIYSFGNLSNIITHQFFSEYHWHMFLLVPYFALIGTVYYLYIAGFTDYSIQIPKIMHFASYILITIAFMLSFIFKKTPYSIIIDIILTAAISLQVVFNGILSVSAFFSYRSKIRDNFSSTGRFRMIWLIFFIAVSFIAWITLLVIELRPNREEAWSVFWLIISVIVYTIGYIGIKQPDILEQMNIVPKKKYEKTAIDPEILQEFDEKLSASVKENIFLDPDLSLPALAEKIGIQTYQLPQVINEKGMNFYEFINRLRIDYAKKIITENKDILNITRVAFDSGFNSISAFNSSFKKFTGMTPSQHTKINE